MKSLLISRCSGVSGGTYFGHFGVGAAWVRQGAADGTAAVACWPLAPFESARPSPRTAPRGGIVGGAGVAWGPCGAAAFVIGDVTGAVAMSADADLTISGIDRGRIDVPRAVDSQGYRS